MDTGAIESQPSIVIVPKDIEMTMTQESAAKCSILVCGTLNITGPKPTVGRLLVANGRVFIDQEADPLESGLEMCVIAKKCKKIAQTRKAFLETYPQGFYDQLRREGWKFLKY